MVDPGYRRDSRAWWTQGTGEIPQRDGPKEQENFQSVMLSTITCLPSVHQDNNTPDNVAHNIAINKVTNEQTNTKQENALSIDGVREGKKGEQTAALPSFVL